MGRGATPVGNSGQLVALVAVDLAADYFHSAGLVVVALNLTESPAEHAFR